MTTTKTKTHLVGVDAGLIWIGDPCYIMGDDASNRVQNWGEFCAKTAYHKHSSEPLGQGIGVLVSSGFGDGQYEVEVETSNEGALGERVKRVTITFIDEEHPPEALFVCEKCGSSDVQETAWLDANTGEVLDIDQPLDYAFCSTCEDTTRLVHAKEVDA